MSWRRFFTLTRLLLTFTWMKLAELFVEGRGRIRSQVAPSKKEEKPQQWCCGMFLLWGGGGGGASREGLGSGLLWCQLCSLSLIFWYPATKFLFHFTVSLSSLLLHELLIWENKIEGNSFVSCLEKRIGRIYATRKYVQMSESKKISVACEPYAHRSSWFDLFSHNSSQHKYVQFYFSTFSSLF